MNWLFNRPYIWCMFVLEAANLLKGVSCPACKKVAEIGTAYPFEQFNALDILMGCDKKKCRAFCESLNTNFLSVDHGQLSRTELNTWLDNFRDKSSY